MKNRIIKIVLISVVVIINIILLVVLINSVKSYITKIENGDIEQVQQNENGELSEDLDLSEQLKGYASGFQLNNIIQIVVIILCIILLVLGIIIYRKI